MKYFYQAINVFLCIIFVSILHAVEPMIATGENHVVYLADDGTVWCWGRNTYGQLGQGDTVGQDNTTEGYGVPRQVKKSESVYLTQAIAVSAGSDFSVALLSDGTVWTWGRNDAWGAIGVGDTSTLIYKYATQVKVDANTYLTEIKAIAAGERHTLAISCDGKVKAWGKGYGLGCGNVSVSKSFPVNMKTSAGVDIKNIKAIAAGASHSLALASDGTVYFCGDGSFDGIDSNAGTLDSIYATQIISSKGPLGLISSFNNIVSIVCGANHCIALTADGVCYTWGSDTNEQLGNGFGTSVSIPTSIVSSGITSISAGSNHSMYINKDGTANIWGLNASNQCKIFRSNSDKISTPVKNSIRETARAFMVSGHGNFTASIERDGAVVTWGSNSFGQLGNGVVDSGSLSSWVVSIAPWPVAHVVEITAGHNHSVARKSDGTAWAWGQNSSGQVGDGSGALSLTSPVQITNILNISSLISGSSNGEHTLALDTNFDIWSWGRNEYGQLGKGTAASSSSLTIPDKVIGGQKARGMATGGYHSLMINSDGRVYSWGRNNAGQLGVAGGVGSSSPTLVSGNDNMNVIAVAAGAEFSLMLRADGKVWAWGRNDFGQLAQPMSILSNATLTEISSLNNIVAIACGAYHGMALKSDGTVWCWGRNDEGQCGDDSTGSPRITPVQLRINSGSSPIYATNIKRIVGGEHCSTAIACDGAAMMWGLDGDLKIAHAHTVVTNGTISIQAGSNHVISLLSNGSIRSWGTNTFGQLGDGTNAPAFSLSPVITIPNWLPTITLNTAMSVLTANENGETSARIQLDRSGGTAGSVTVSLNITGTATPGSDFESLSSSTLTFVGGGNDPQASKIIYIKTKDDLIDDDNETVIVNILPSQNDYRSGLAGGAVVTVEDNDAAGVAVVKTSNFGWSTTEAEGEGHVLSFTLALKSEPTSNVTINPRSSNTSEAVINIATSSIVFTPGNWQIPQVVIVTGQSDLIDDGDVPYAINFSVSAAVDQRYNNMVVDAISVINKDMDVAGFTVELPNNQTAPLRTLEKTLMTTHVSGGIAYFSSEKDLESVRPGMTALFSGGHSNDGAAYIIVSKSGSSLHIESSNGIRGPSDSLDVESVRFGSYATIWPTTKPNSAVTVNISVSDSSKGIISPVSLTWPAGDSDPKRVYLSPVNDDIADGDKTYSIITSPAISNDPSYQGLDPDNIAAETLDDDIKGIVVTQSGGSTAITEGGATDSYTIQLATQPIGNVTISISTNARYTLSSGLLIFTPENWNSAQTVVITAIDDAIDQIVDPITHNDQQVVAIIHSVLEGEYTGISKNINAIITDNDPGGIISHKSVIVTPTSGLTVTESAGGVAFFALNLDAQPSISTIVSISLTMSDETVAKLSRLTGEFASPIIVEFNNSNWQIPQLFKVVGVDNEIDDGANRRFTIQTSATTVNSGGDPTFSGLDVPDITGTTIDNDQKGVIFSSTSLTATEGGEQSTYSLRLSSKPTGNIAISINADGQVMVSPSSITFTPNDPVNKWSIPQMVTVTAVNDDIDEGGSTHTGIISHSASGGGYDGILISNTTVAITDNDEAGFVVTGPALSNPIVHETGTVAPFSVHLRSRPTAVVVLNWLCSDSVEASVSPASMTFTPDNWNVNQVVTITGLNDDIADGDKTFTVSGTSISTDPYYSSNKTDVLNLVNRDDDTFGVLIVSTSVKSDGKLVTTESGGTGIFTIRLKSKPTADVSISLTSTNETQGGTVFPSSVKFPPLDWDKPQVVTVTGKNNNSEGNGAFDISYSIITGSAIVSNGVDLNYNGYHETDVAMINKRINDYPTIDDMQSVQMNEDADPLLVNLTGISTGQASEVQKLTITAISSDAGVTPMVVYKNGETTATVMLQSDKNFNGVATIAVNVTDDAAIDGTARTTLKNFQVTVNAINDAPVLDLDLSEVGRVASYTEGDASVHVVDQSVTITDVDNEKLDHAVIKLTNLIDGNSEVLNVDTTGTVLVPVWSVARDTITLTGTADISDYVQVFKTITYKNNSSHPTTNNRTIEITVYDENDASNSEVVIVHMHEVAIPPVVDLNGAAIGGDMTVTFTEGESPVPIGDATLSILEPDADTIISATFTLKNPQDTGDEFLSVNLGSGSGLFASYMAPILTITGSASTSTYASVLRSVTYYNASKNPTVLPDRIVEVVVNDGQQISAPVICTITLESVNSLPSVKNNKGLLVSMGGSGTISGNSLEAEDADLGNNILSFIVNLIPGKGKLKKNGILISNGGIFTSEDIENNRVVYTSDGTLSGDDGFVFTVSDGETSSNATVFKITIAGLAPPVLGLESGSLEYMENAVPVRLDSAATIVDIDFRPSFGYANATLFISIISGGDAADVFSIDDITGQVSTDGSTVSYNGIAVGAKSGGTNNTALQVVFNENATPAIAQAILRTIEYSNAGHDPTSGNRVQRIIGVSMTDETNQVSAEISRIINILPVNDAPLVSALYLGVVFNTHRTVTIPASDPENQDMTMMVEPGFEASHGAVTIESSNRLTLSFVPFNNFFGEDHFTIRVSDGFLSTNCVVQVMVSNPGSSQTSIEFISVPPYEIAAGQPLLYNPMIKGSHPNISFELEGLTANETLTFNNETGSFIWNPVPSVVPLGGYYQFKIFAYDSVSHSSGVQPVLIKVRPAPVVAQ